MSRKLVAALRDLTDRKDVVFNGPGNFVIGLDTTGSIVVEPQENSDAVCIVLLELTVSPSGGYVLAPANYDLPCMVNDSEELTGEINLIDGARLEVANKTLVFIDGPIPVRRRKLPRTPGMPLEESPPAKPSRVRMSSEEPAEAEEQDSLADSSVNSHQADYDGDNDDSDDDGGADKRWLETSWCVLDMPSAEQQLFLDLKTPEQISIVAASYFCKQLRLFTDANVTPQLLDDVFKLFRDSVVNAKDNIMDYLSDISKIIQKNPKRSQTRPMHAPAIKLLNGLLKESYDSLSRVIQLLDLLRTFSHFDFNMATMAHHQVAATVVGCMSVYCDVVEVQSYGLDTLAKIAKFKPDIKRKAPLREGAVQIMLKAEEQHHKNLTVCRSLCRVLANLSASLIDVTNSLLDRETATNPVIVEAIGRYEECLLFMFKQSLPVVQKILDDHGTDLGVRTEGRRFVYHYAKLPQLQQKKKVWLLQDEEEVEITEEVDTSGPAIQQLIAYPDEEKEPKGILKKVGSFENLRDPGKKLTFADNTEGGSASDTSSGEDDMFECPFPEPFPTEIEVDEDFSFHLVKTFISKTIGKPKFFDLSDSSDDDILVSAPKKLLATKKPVIQIAQKLETKGDSQSLDSEVSQKLTGTKSERSLAGDTSQLQFVESHYFKDSYSCDTEQRDMVEDMLTNAGDVKDQSNTLENVSSKNIKTSEENKKKKTLNGYQEEVLTGSPQLCITDTAPFNNNGNSLGDINENNPLVVSANIGSHILSEWTSTESTKLKEISQNSVEQNRSYSELVNENKNEMTPDISKSIAIESDNNINLSGSITLQTVKENNDVDEPDRGPEIKFNGKPLSPSDRTVDSSFADVQFMGKLVRTQIITHVGSLVFQGDDTKVLSVIDQPINELLKHAGAPEGLIEFARMQYGDRMTLMDLEPSIVISAIDAVRYRSVTADLVQKAVLSLTRALTHKLQPSTVNITMIFYKILFSDENLKSVVSEKDFVQEFKVCFSNATVRLQASHSIEEIRAKLSSPSFVV